MNYSQADLYVLKIYDNLLCVRVYVCYVSVCVSIYTYIYKHISIYMIVYIHIYVYIYILYLTVIVDIMNIISVNYNQRTILGNSCTLLHTFKS